MSIVYSTVQYSKNIDLDNSRNDMFHGHTVRAHGDGSEKATADVHVARSVSSLMFFFIYEIRMEHSFSSCNKSILLRSTTQGHERSTLGSRIKPVNLHSAP